VSYNQPVRSNSIGSQPCHPPETGDDSAPRDRRLEVNIEPAARVQEWQSLACFPMPQFCAGRPASTGRETPPARTASKTAARAGEGSPKRRMSETAGQVRGAWNRDGRPPLKLIMLCV
jgi:hypothetical protein